MILALDKPNLDALRVSEPYDVCIIGSGPAGSVLATLLAEKKVRTLLVESGRGLSQWLFDNRMKRLAKYEFSGNTSYPLTKTRARLLGGNSNFWTGRCERFHPSDFLRHPYTPKENPWPIDYSDLDHFYEMAEKTLRVRGNPTRSQHSPPRLQPLPISSNADIKFLSHLIGKLHIDVDDSPTATPSKTIRFFKVQREVLPRFLKSPFGFLVAGVTATKLIGGDGNGISGVQLQTLKGDKETARARIFVLACGGIENSRLLLLSKSEQFPTGVGNRSDWVGRGFNEHPAVNFYARIPHSWETLKPTNKIGRTHQFYQTFRSEGLGSILPVFRQAWILPHHVMPFRLSGLPRLAINALGRFKKATLYIGATIEQKISDQNRITLSPNQNDVFGNPIAKLNFSFCEEDLHLFDRCRELASSWYNEVGAEDVFEADITWSRHHQGTCRMGTNPNTSVVDSNLKVHESSNLYVCGSDVFVTGGAMQPCLSIVAFAHRLADHLVLRFGEGEL